MSTLPSRFVLAFRLDEVFWVYEVQYEQRLPCWRELALISHFYESESIFSPNIAHLNGDRIGSGCWQGQRPYIRSILSEQCAFGREDRY